MTEEGGGLGTLWGGRYSGGWKPHLTRWGDRCSYSRVDGVGRIRTCGGSRTPSGILYEVPTSPPLNRRTDSLWKHYLHPTVTSRIKYHSDRPKWKKTQLLLHLQLECRKLRSSIVNLHTGAESLISGGFVCIYENHMSARITQNK